MGGLRYKIRDPKFKMKGNSDPNSNLYQSGDGTQAGDINR
jgi:hypothetical protein